MIRSLLVGFLATATISAGCVTSVNSPIRVADGETRTGSLRTVNGRIELGSGSHVTGRCSTVNGEVRLGDGARVGGLETVNGSIRGGRSVEVDGDVDTVNGSVSLLGESRVAGEIYTINGGVTLKGSVVERGLRTVHGSVRLYESAVVRGDVVFEKKIGSSWSGTKPIVVVVAGGSVIEGDLIVEDRDLRVRVHLSGGGKVAGRVENAEVVEEAPSGSVEGP